MTFFNVYFIFLFDKKNLKYTRLMKSDLVEINYNDIHEIIKSFYLNNSRENLIQFTVKYF